MTYDEAQAVRLRLSSLPKQSHLKENGQVGDCWRRCIAAVIGMPAEELPHWVEEMINFRETDRNRWYDSDRETQMWLDARGWVLVELRGYLMIPHFEGEDRRTDVVSEPLVIECGPTVRSKQPSDTHAVITWCNYLVYDPHPSNAGLLATTTRYLVIPKPSLLA